MLPNLLPPLCVSLCYQEAENLVATVVPTHLAAAVPEVAVYLKESVGNSTRIDYGTGICCSRCLLGCTARSPWAACSLLQGILGPSEQAAFWGPLVPAVLSWSARGS